MKRTGIARTRKWPIRAGLFVVMAVTFGVEPRPVLAAVEPSPCSTNAEGRQLDYWLGDWTVTYPGSPGSGTSKVYLSLDQCLVVESWDSGMGLKGENVLAYNSEEKRWQGVYADNHGRVHVLEGKVTPGLAEFQGPSHGPKGEAVLNRVKVIRITVNKVEQSWEKSVDNGVTWKLEFRGQYARKTP